MNQITPYASTAHDLETPRTLASILGDLEAASGLTGRQRRDWPSAIRSLCRIVGKRPDQVAAATTVIRALLAKVTPASAGLSPKRLQNLKSDALAALRYCGATISADTSDFAPMSLAWEELWSRIANDQIRFKLSRLFRLASARQLRPDRITDSVLRDLLVILRDASLTRDPVSHVRGAIWAWNRCMELVEGWPRIRLARLAPERQGWTLPLSAFPQSFRTDLDSWLARLRGDDLLAPDGLIRPLKPATLKHRAFQVRMVASAAVKCGTPIQAITTLAVLADPKVMAAAMSWIIERAGGQRTEAMGGMVVAIKSLARHYLKVPAGQMAMLDRISGQMAPRRKGLRPKNRRRLRQLDDERMLARLLGFSKQQFERAMRSMPATRNDAFRAQMAIVVEILLMTGIRLKNLANLELDKHLVWSRPGRRGTLHLVIDAHEVKNDSVIERELPAESARLIRTYVDKFLPLLASAPTSFLFPGRNGGAKKGTLLSNQVSRTLKREIGLEFNVHLFRHLAAKLILDRHPEAHELARRVLGHASIETTTQAYVGMESKSAGKAYDDIVLAHRHRRPVR